MNEPLTHDEQCALRSGMGRLMRVARIARRDALYDATIAAQTCEAVGKVLLYPIDFEGVVDVDIATSIKNIKCARINGYSDFLEKKAKDAGRVNLLKNNKKMYTSETHTKSRNLLYFQVSIKIKIGW